MDNKIMKPVSGELNEDGSFVIKKEETPTGYRETIKVGKLKIRGESKPRIIPYADYAKLVMFYSSQERLIADRKNIIVHLSDGSFVNTADITSLDLVEDMRFTAKPLTDETKRFRDLPTSWILLDLDLNPIIENGKIVGGGTAYFPKDREYWYVAKCHYKYHYDEKDRIVNDGFITKPIENVAELLKVRRDRYNPEYECLSQRIIYGVDVPLRNEVKK